ncbi:hypothetical protein J6590_107065, partial [Homalodisca vitripennis]
RHFDKRQDLCNKVSRGSLADFNQDLVSHPLTELPSSLNTPKVPSVRDVSVFQIFIRKSFKQWIRLIDIIYKPGFLMMSSLCSLGPDGVAGGLRDSEKFGTARILPMLYP